MTALAIAAEELCLGTSSTDIGAGISAGIGASLPSIAFVLAKGSGLRKRLILVSELFWKRTHQQASVHPQAYN